MPGVYSCFLPNTKTWVNLAHIREILQTEADGHAAVTWSDGQVSLIEANDAIYLINSWQIASARLNDSFSAQAEFKVDALNPNWCYYSVFSVLIKATKAINDVGLLISGRQDADSSTNVQIKEYLTIVANDFDKLIHQDLR